LGFSQDTLEGFLERWGSADLEERMLLRIEIDVAVAMQDGARIEMVADYFKVTFPNILLSWLWFRRYILAYPERCVPEMKDCHCWGETKVGDPWAVSEGEYPLALRDKATADLDDGVESERALREVRAEFEGHVGWFRCLVLGLNVFEISSHGGRDGIGLDLPDSGLVLCGLGEGRLHFFVA
jgi:hypothetical protein